MPKRTSLVAGLTALLAVGLALTTPVAAQAGRFITGGDIKNGSVTSADVSNGTLKKRDFARSALPAEGPRGPQGEQGDLGPSGVVATEFQTGLAVRPTTVLGFVAPTARITVQEGQRVFVTSSAALGATPGGNGARNLDLDVCYQGVDGDIALVGVPISGLSLAPNYQTLFTLSAVKDDFAPGLYDVGLCGVTSDPVDWSTVGGGQTTVQVFRQP